MKGIYIKGELPKKCSEVTYLCKYNGCNDDEDSIKSSKDVERRSDCPIQSVAELTEPLEHRIKVLELALVLISRQNNNFREMTCYVNHRDCNSINIKCCKCPQYFIKKAEQKLNDESQLKLENNE